MLFDSECPVCDRRSAGGAVCARCEADLAPPPALASPRGLDACRAITAYEGRGRELVTRLKFQNRRGSLSFAAARLAALARSDAVDVVTWAPTSPGRRRRRGFDQAELLARSVGRSLGVPVVGCLIRVPGPPQTGRHRSERVGGPRFDARRGIAAASGRRIAVVDDVVTTGATLSSAAAVLRDAGADHVVGLVVARTPRPR
ncbi:MAG: ComF family protein [Actinobacteria bacterium]|nr:ComF family protein [Actinomycetota bacterium]